MERRGGLATSQCQVLAAPEAEKSKWVTFRLFQILYTNLTAGVLTTTARIVKHSHVMVYYSDIQPVCHKNV